MYQPVLVAQGFKWSSCTATLMDEHALGAPLGAWKDGICSSTMPLYPTRGQWLPYRGQNMEKTSFPPPSAHLSGGRGFKPRDRRKIFLHKIQLLAWRDDTHAQADFPISLPSHTTCSLLPRSFLPALPSSSWIFSKLLTPTRTHTDFPIFLFYPKKYSQAPAG